jgi:hypothetical protein
MLLGRLSRALSRQLKVMLLSIVYLSSCLSPVYSRFPSYVPFIKVLSSETKPRWDKNNHSPMDRGKGMRSKLQEVALPKVVLLEHWVRFLLFCSSICLAVLLLKPLLLVMAICISGHRKYISIVSLRNPTEWRKSAGWLVSRPCGGCARACRERRWRRGCRARCTSGDAGSRGGACHSLMAIGAIPGEEGWFHKFVLSWLVAGATGRFPVVLPLVAVCLCVVRVIR